jgi:hypothetical protein
LRSGGDGKIKKVVKQSEVLRKELDQEKSMKERRKS